MTINEKLVKYNFSSRNNTPIKYIVIHDTGNTSSGADANAHFIFFNSADRNSSAHYFVDDKQILRIIKESDKSWHCGDGRGKYGITNENSIGIELCINVNGDFNKTFELGAELTASLVKKYNLSLDNVVRHYDASRKVCPNIMSKNNWKMWGEFKNKVASYYKDLSSNIIVDKISLFLDGVYMTFFGREPDENGKNFWYNKLKSKESTVDEFILSIIGSEEFAEFKKDLFS